MSGRAGFYRVAREMKRGLAELVRRVPDTLLYLGITGGIVWLAIRGAATSGYDWQWMRVWSSLYTLAEPVSGSASSPVSVWNSFRPGPLLLGLGVTLRISFFGLILAVLAGVGAAAARIAGGPATRALAALYIQTVRNTPLLVQLFVVYFIIAPRFGLGAEPSAVLALGLFEGAYMAEIFRAGILAVPEGQWEAALTLGFSRARSFRLIVLPQAVRHALPPLVSQSVSLLKDSSLAGSIAIVELTQSGRLVAAEQFTAFETWLLVAAIYLVLALFLSGLSILARRHFNKGFAH